VYPDAPDDDTAFKRLLLENVLLLAGRREPKDMTHDPSDEEVSTELLLSHCTHTIHVISFCVLIFFSSVQANHVLKEKFGKSLLNIYKHYTEISERRRHQEYATENNLKYKKMNIAIALQEKLTPEMKALQKKLKHTLGYHEFFKVDNQPVSFLLSHYYLVII
jgi:hypothetical protein